jgi:hypothetical protein
LTFGQRAERPPILEEFMTMILDERLVDARAGQLIAPVTLATTPRAPSTTGWSTSAPAVVRCGATSDVVAALEPTRRFGLEVSIRGGGTT